MTSARFLFSFKLWHNQCKVLMTAEAASVHDRHKPDLGTRGPIDNGGMLRKKAERKKRSAAPQPTIRRRPRGKAPKGLFVQCGCCRRRRRGGCRPRSGNTCSGGRRRGVCGRRMAPRESRHTLHAARGMHALGNRASAPLAFTSVARQQGIPSCDLFGGPCSTCIWRFPGPPD